MAKEKTKLKEPELPRKPKAPKAPEKPNEIIRKDFSISIPQYCHFDEDDEFYTDGQLKDCFVCSNGLRTLCSKKEISFADLLKIRSKINDTDEQIIFNAETGKYEEEIKISWAQNIENPNYQSDLGKYQEKLEKFSSKLVEHETKLKEYEHKLEEYKILKAEFIKQKAEQDLNSLLK